MSPLYVNEITAVHLEAPSSDGYNGSGPWPQPPGPNRYHELDKDKDPFNP